MAVKFSVPPTGMVAVAGLTVMDVRAAVTVRTSTGLTVAPSVAVMFEVPTATPVASPPGEVMVATPRVAESHVT